MCFFVDLLRFSEIACSELQPTLRSQINEDEELASGTCFSSISMGL